MLFFVVTMFFNIRAITDLKKIWKVPPSTPQSTAKHFLSMTYGEMKY